MAGWGAAALAVFGAVSARAQIVWAGGNGANANKWNRNQNWNGGGVPTSTDAVQFDNTASSGNLAPDIASTNTAVGAITFTSGTTNAYNLSGTATLTLGSATAAGITNSSGTNEALGISTIALGIGQTWTAGGTGNLTISSAVSLGSKALTLAGSAAGAGGISGVVSGTGSLLKSGSGTWALSGTNTYTGVTSISGGVLSVAMIGNGGVAGNLGQATAAAGNLVFDGGTLQYTGATASSNRSFTINSGKTATFDVTTSDLTLSGAAASSSGGLTKTGAGTLTLAGTNLYTGLTTVSAGTLTYGANDVLASGGVTVDGATAILSLGASHTDTVGTVTVANGGSITGTGTSTLTGTGTFEMQSGSVSANLAGAGVALNKTTGGTVALSGASTAVGNVTTSGGTLDAGSASTTTGTVTVNAGTATFSGNATTTDAVTVNAGTLNFNGANATTGQVHLLGGAGSTIAVATGATLTTDEFDSAANTILSIASGGTVVANYNAGNAVFSGQITGSGTFKALGGAHVTFDTSISAPNLTVFFGGTSVGTMASALTVTLTGATTLQFGTLHITGDTILDFGNSSASVLNSANVVIDSGVKVSVINWVGLTDAWYASSTFTQNGGPAAVLYTDASAPPPNAPPENQITYSGFTDANTAWVSSSAGNYYDHEIRPVPEPSTYGLIFISGCLAFLGFRRFPRRLLPLRA